MAVMIMVMRMIMGMIMIVLLRVDVIAALAMPVMMARLVRGFRRGGIPWNDCETERANLFLDIIGSRRGCFRASERYGLGGEVDRNVG